MLVTIPLSLSPPLSLTLSPPLLSHAELPEMSETTALGAAFAAGRAAGVWRDLSALPKSPTATFLPSIDHDGECVLMECNQPPPPPPPPPPPLPPVLPPPSPPPFQSVMLATLAGRRL